MGNRIVCTCCTVTCATELKNEGRATGRGLCRTVSAVIGLVAPMAGAWIISLSGGMNAAGLQADFAGIPRSNMLKVLGVDLFSIGQIHPGDASYEVIEEQIDGQYFYFVFRDSYLVSAILLGDTTLSAAVKQVVEKRHDCSKILQTRPEIQEILDFVAAAQ